MLKFAVMLATEYEKTALPSLQSSLGDVVVMEAPGDDDDIEDGEGDWTDIDDEDFEDEAGDEEDLHQIELDNDIFDPEDDDHLPDDDI